MEAEAESNWVARASAEAKAKTDVIGAAITGHLSGLLGTKLCEKPLPNSELAAIAKQLIKLGREGRAP